MPKIGDGDVWGRGGRSVDDATSRQVLAAANFESHKFVNSVEEKFAAAGFTVGVAVELARRVTHEFGPKKVRKDVEKGHRKHILRVTRQAH